MGDHNLRQPLWDGNAEAPERPMRRPNLTAPGNPAEISDSQHNSATINSSTVDDILSKTKLSVNAEEWFPPNYTPTVPIESMSSLQQRLQKYKNPPDNDNETQQNSIRFVNPDESIRNLANPEADICASVEPVSVQQRLQKYKKPSESQMKVQQNPVECANLEEASRDLAKLEIDICTLIEDPGQYDKLIRSFIEILGPYYEDVNVVSTATNLLFNQALEEPNFRYNAARLCKTIEEQCPLFRSALHLLCEKKIRDNPYDANLVLFLAELYSQLNYDNLYGRHVIQTLQCVLSLGDNNNVKAACQVLKLTGASLETYNKTAVSAIFAQLEVVKQCTAVHSSVIDLINSVIALRLSNWGQMQSSSSNVSSRYESGQVQTPQDEPIFYGPDGQELTEEERQFLADNCSNQLDFLLDDSDPDSLWDPDPEMDEEMQAAFRQFIQLGK